MEVFTQGIQNDAVMGAHHDAAQQGLQLAPELKYARRHSLRSCPPRESV
jgi:hypothetical protein